MEDYSEKIYTEKAIILATFLGGPVAAGFLIGKNYKAFGKENAAHNSVLLGIIATLILLVGLFYFPVAALDKIPTMAIPFIYTTIISIFVKKYQGDQIREYLSHEGQAESGWKAVGYGLVGSILIFVVVFIMVFNVPFKGYEKKVNISRNVVLHYSQEIDKLNPDTLVKVFQELQFINTSRKSDLFLSIENNTYKLKFVILNPSVLENVQIISVFNELENLMNSRLKPDKKIVIGFINQDMTVDYDLPPDMKSINHQSAVLSKLRLYHIDHYHTIFYNETMPLSDIQKVGESVKRLKGYFPENQYIDIVFLNNGRDYTIKFFVAKDLWNDPVTLSELKGSVTYFNDSGITKLIHLVIVDAGTLEEKQL